MRLMIGREDGAAGFAMRIFEVNPAGHTPLHQHNYEHEVLVLEGGGRLVDNADSDAGRPIAAGDAIFVPANHMHQFRADDDRPLKFMCLVPTQFDCGQGPMPTPGS